jgi:hypothetical protein
MQKALGTLIVAFDFSAISADEFHDWYDSEHLAERLSVPGFISAQRWLAVDNPRLSVVTYEVEHVGVLSSPAYRAISGAGFSPWTQRINRSCKLVARYVGSQILPGDRAAPDAAQGLLLLAMNVDEAAEDEFNRWNDSEHFPRLSAVTGVLSARRYRCTEGAQKYLAVYHTTTPEVVDSPAWIEARETPWTHRMRAHTRERMRIVCRRYHRAAEG